VLLEECSVQRVRRIPSNLLCKILAGSNHICVFDEHKFVQQLTDRFAFTFFPAAFDVRMR
jgi:hypothetical protein